jgi:hypothetical protein
MKKESKPCRRVFGINFLDINHQPIADSSSSGAQNAQMQLKNPDVPGLPSETAAA